MGWERDESWWIRKKGEERGVRDGMEWDGKRRKDGGEARGTE